MKKLIVISLVYFFSISCSLKQGSSAYLYKAYLKGELHYEATQISDTMNVGLTVYGENDYFISSMLITNNGKGISLSGNKVSLIELAEIGIDTVNIECLSIDHITISSEKIEQYTLADLPVVLHYKGRREYDRPDLGVSNVAVCK